MPTSFKINHCTEELEVMSIPEIMKSICQWQLDFAVTLLTDSSSQARRKCLIAGKWTVVIF